MQRSFVLKDSHTESVAGERRRQSRWATRWTSLELRLTRLVGLLERVASGRSFANNVHQRSLATSTKSADGCGRLDLLSVRRRTKYTVRVQSSQHTSVLKSIPSTSRSPDVLQRAFVADAVRLTTIFSLFHLLDEPHFFRVKC